MGQENPPAATRSKSPSPGEREPSPWQARYGDKFRPQRIKQFPAGILPPRLVRIYQRESYYLLQWWDKEGKRTFNERVDGDVIEAVVRARRIDERLENFRTSGVQPRRRTARELVELYLADLARRADAAEIDVKTVGRYESAIRRFLDFAEQPAIAARYQHMTKVDRDFKLAFAAYLTSLTVGRTATGRVRPLKGQSFILDVVRGMFQWAADHERAKLLPTGFRNPFVGRSRRSDKVTLDPVRSPDITMAMATDLIAAADPFQLSVLAPVLLYGLRPAELGWLFRERLDDAWLKVACVPELDYMTKGRRDKRFPVPPCLCQLWSSCATPSASGLLYAHRRVVGGKARPPMLGRTLVELAAEYRRRCASVGQITAVEKRRVRTELMRAAGQLDYDCVEGEFRKLAHALKWPAAATLKDLRHLFATCLEDAGVPEFYRRYFMGQSLGTASIVVYTHLTEDKIQQHYAKALETELAPMVAAIEARLRGGNL